LALLGDKLAVCVLHAFVPSQGVTRIVRGSDGPLSISSRAVNVAWLGKCFAKGTPLSSLNLDEAAAVIAGHSKGDSDGSNHNQNCVNQLGFALNLILTFMLQPLVLAMLSLSIDR